MSSYRFREAASTDLGFIADSQLLMAWETEGLRLDAETCKKGVAAVFESPGIGRYYVAELEGACVACLLVQHEWSDWRNGTVWWIHSVYVTPECRRSGVFRGLYRHVQAAANLDPAIKGIRLFVEKKNKTAQSTYRRLGMSNEHYDLFEWMK